MDNEPSIEDKLKAVLVNPRLIKAAVRHITKTRPNGWGGRSNSAYYKEFYGQQMKDVYDGIASDGKPRWFSYSEAKAIGLSAQSLYVRVNQSIRYLLEQMETPDLTYAKLHRRIVIQRHIGEGIEIRLGMEGDVSAAEHHIRSMKPNTVVYAITRETPRWRQDLDKWLKDAKIGDEFLYDKLLLDKQQIDALEEEFNAVKDLLYSFTSTKIFIVKISPEVL